MRYWYYPLLKTSHVCLAEKSKLLREQVKTFQATFENTKSSGKDPVLIFDLLTRFFKKADALGASEGHAFLTLPKLLKGRDERHLRSTRNGARSSGAADWPEAVSYPICTYATPVTIRNAVNDFQNSRRQPSENELIYSGRLDYAAHCCRNV